MTVYATDRIYVFRLGPGAEILKALTAHCAKHNIQQSVIQGIGTLRDPVIGSYDFEDQEYRRLELPGIWELLTLNANSSLKEGTPFIHAHATLGDAKGHCRGGHLFSAEVLVAEVTVHALAGRPLERYTDPETGLSLWPTKDQV